MNGDLKRRLRRVEDRIELSDLVARYGVAVDDRDYDGLAGLYARDCVFEHATGRSEGRDAVIAYYRERGDYFGPTYHIPHSQTVEFQSDDEATGVVAAHAELTIDGRAFVVAIRYSDRYVREDGTWRFRERATRFLYALPLDELPASMDDELRVRWPGTEPKHADLPDSTPSYQSFVAERKAQQ